MSPFFSAEYGDLLYIKPWSRFGTYFVGVVLGMLYFEHKNATKYQGMENSVGHRMFSLLAESSGTRWAFYINGFLITTVFVFIQHWAYKEWPYNLNPWSGAANAYFNGFSRQIFVTGLALILCPVFAGKGSLLRYLLAGHFWTPLARLSFAGYLIHLLIFEYYLWTQRTSFYWQHINVLHLYLGTVFFTFLFALPYSLLCEIPFMNIEKFILFPPRERKPVTEKEEDMRLYPLSDDDASPREEISNLSKKIADRDLRINLST